MHLSFPYSPVHPSNNFLDTFLTNDLVAIHVQVQNRGWNIIQGIFLLNEK